MKDWTSGYVSDIGYTFGYYSELNPLRMKLALLNHGIALPQFGTACELGFGQGLSANIHAAATSANWYGTDFNPSQVAFAQELSRVSGANAELVDDAFLDYANRSDLPDFDYIGLHGIWSWISDENRSVIADFIRRKLKVGGVVYVSYNTLPGWAAFAPLRHLMTEHAEIIGSEGRGIVSRIGDAIEFADQMLATNPMFSRANPLVGDRVKKLKEQNAHYLAHEYFNRDWHPMHFATMSRWLDKAKVNYACSSNYLDHLDQINLTKEQQQFLAEIPDAMFKESVRDFMVNQQFRRDYWVKGVRRLNRVEQLEVLRQQRVVLSSYRPEMQLKVTGALGEADMAERVYGPILDALASNKPISLGEIEAAVSKHEINFSEVMQAAMLLIGAGHLHIAQTDDEVTTTKVQSDKLNDHLISLAKGSNDVSHLASPMIGGGFPVNRFQQLFILAFKSGQSSPEDWAKFAWQTISSQGQRIIKENKTLETDEENYAEMLTQAQAFAEKTLPILKKFAVV